jgi:hypothetical protein
MRGGEGERGGRGERGERRWRGMERIPSKAIITLL